MWYGMSVYLAPLPHHHLPDELPAVSQLFLLVPDHTHQSHVLSPHHTELIRHPQDVWVLHKMVRNRLHEHFHRPQRTVTIGGHPGGGCGIGGLIVLVVVVASMLLLA